MKKFIYGMVLRTCGRGNADGNPTEAGGSAHNDILHGTTAGDHIKGLGGIDHIYAASPSAVPGQVPEGDFIEAGGGDGWGTANAQPMNTFSDYVEAGNGNDHIYADSYVSTATAIAQGNSDTNQDYIGLAALGGGGDDVIVGSSGRDYLAGGAGADLLIGGAGNDIIEGSTDNDATGALDDWGGIGTSDAYVFLTADTAQSEIPVSDPDGTTSHSTRPSNDNGQVVGYSTGSGQVPGDVIYAGAGSDYVGGSNGNDVIFGEDGNDVAWGGFGNDVIFGEGGTDRLHLEDLSVLSGVEMDTLKDNGTHHARCAVLFGRERSESANDASYGSSFERRWA